jgi:RNase H-like domain found in reverse transcriptase/Reverse transcriptase (RNA-dependent DNA polymerase)
MYVDNRARFKSTIKNNYPLPRIEEVLDQLGGSKYFSAIDLRSGYNQIRIAEDDVHKTGVRTRFGLFEFLVVPFGLSNAPPILRSLMNDVLREYLNDWCIVYLDDILLHLHTPEEHLEHIDLVFKKMCDHNLYGKLSKSQFMRKEFEYLGHVISGEGISVEPSKIEAVKDWATPQDPRRLQSFLGLCNYYRRFVRTISTKASPLIDLTKKAIPFEWGESQDKAFKELKDRVMTAPILKSADVSQPFEIQTDGSRTCTGAVLQHRDNTGVARPVAYISLKLNAAEQNYPTHVREFLAIVQALTLWPPYLLSHHFMVLTDHNPLPHFQSQSILSRRQARHVLLEHLEHT